MLLSNALSAASVALTDTYAELWLTDSQCCTHRLDTRGEDYGKVDGEPKEGAFPN